MEDRYDYNIIHLPLQLSESDRETVDNLNLILSDLQMCYQRDSEPYRKLLVDIYAKYTPRMVIKKIPLGVRTLPEPKEAEPSPSELKLPTIMALKNFGKQIDRQPILDEDDGIFDPS